MARRGKAEAGALRHGPRPTARLGAFFAILLLLAATVHPLWAPITDHAGGSDDRHFHAEREPTPSDPDRHGPEHQGCHFCRLDGVALPPPQVAVVSPLRDFEVCRIALQDAPGAVSARLIRPYVRGPPRRA